jgi:hypothetical protein
MPSSCLSCSAQLKPLVTTIHDPVTLVYDLELPCDRLAAAQRLRAGCHSHRDVGAAHRPADRGCRTGRDGQREHGHQRHASRRRRPLAYPVFLPRLQSFAAWGERSR